ncbi:MAG: GNAT family N-acetyltransferase [Chloroflexaceae bacterium]|jgi:ribosomal protein S18 acetylase RimI-like enzyme|nr:GNAT family N-acetyltransferase [Chloroflexaceae bacterium]
MPTITLHHATAASLPAIVALIHTAFEEYRGAVEPPLSAHSETVEHLQELLNQGGMFFEARQGDVLVGCVFCQQRDDAMYLGRLAVLPALRGAGIGQRLIAAVEEQARVQGATRIQLGTRLAHSANQAYYQRLGFRIVDYRSHPGYTEPTFVWMEKTL